MSDSLHCESEWPKKEPQIAGYADMKFAKRSHALGEPVEGSGFNVQNSRKLRNEANVDLPAKFVQSADSVPSLPSFPSGNGSTGIWPKYGRIRLDPTFEIFKRGNDSRPSKVRSSRKNAKRTQCFRRHTTFPSVKTVKSAVQTELPNEPTARRREVGEREKGMEFGCNGQFLPNEPIPESCPLVFIRGSTGEITKQSHALGAPVSRFRVQGSKVCSPRPPRARKLPNEPNLYGWQISGSQI